jgi:hypothetical protein
MKFATVKDHGQTYRFYFNHFCLTKLLNMAMVRNFEVALGETLNNHMVEFCNFVQCHIFVKYLTCYY